MIFTHCILTFQSILFINTLRCVVLIKSTKLVYCRINYSRCFQDHFRKLYVDAVSLRIKLITGTRSHKVSVIIHVWTIKHDIT